jgi:hypothetical protein
MWGDGMKLKDLKANQVPFYYQNPGKEVDILDEDGYMTGETEITGGEIVKAYARISPNTADYINAPFGKDLVYDKMISTVQDLPINEETKLFIDVVPKYDFNGDTDTKPDYEVVRVAKDMHQKLWAIRRVEGYDNHLR